MYGVLRTALRARIFGLKKIKKSGGGRDPDNKAVDIGYWILDIGYWGLVSSPEIRLQKILGIR